MPLGRTPTGRIVDWKPPAPAKEAAHKCAGGDTPAQQGHKDAQQTEHIQPSGQRAQLVFVASLRAERHSLDSVGMTALVTL